MKVLAVSAHPDDETLGCGGTLLKHRDAGDVIEWVIATAAHSPKWSDEIIGIKHREIEAVAKRYSVSEIHRLGFPSGRLDITPIEVLIERFAEAIENARPTVVYAVHPGDTHTDHHSVFTALTCVLKSFHMGRLGVQRLLCYETLSSSEAAPPFAHRAFLPTVFVDISQHIEEKIEVMKIFETESQPDPYPRGPEAIRALARFRGASVNIEYAEAFQLVRELL